MLKLVERKMEEIYKNLEMKINSMETLCSLNKFNFKGDDLPVYSNEVEQDIYLLRYLPAYFSEYYFLYQDILENKPPNRLNVLSIGCGCGVDLWGLKFAKEKLNNESSVNYIGSDLVDWRYKEIDDEAKYKIGNILDVKNIEDRNVIIFPKSIGEFDEQTFRRLKEKLGNCKFSNKNIVLCGSIRKSRCEEDLNRIESIVLAMKNYKKKDKTEVFEFKEKDNGYNWRLNEVIEGFEYPISIKKKYKNINQRCRNYNLEEQKNCTDECSTNFSRILNPITTVSQIKYCLVKLERKI